MNRRNFIAMFGAGVAVAAAPVYFDMGKNLWRLDYCITELPTFGDELRFREIFDQVVAGLYKVPELYVDPYNKITWT